MRAPAPCPLAGTTDPAGQTGASQQVPVAVGGVADVRNCGADRVLDLIERAAGHGGVSASSSVVESLIDPAQARDVAADIDETIWEDAETQLRHHSQLSPNFLLTMAMGGAIASCG